MRRATITDEDGFTLIECLVAALVLMILSAAVLGVVTTTLKTARTDNARVGASQLASRQIETLRQQFTFGTDTTRSDIEDGTWSMVPLPGQASGSTQTVNGIPYSVRLSVQPLVLGVGHSNCEGGSAVAHPSYLATVSISWPQQGVSADVTNATVLTPPKSTTSDATEGYLAAQVLNAAGQPNPNQVVTFSGPGGTQTQVTDGTGCAVAQFGTAGMYTVTLDEAGYVDLTSQAVSTAPATLALGQLTTTQLHYDQAAVLNVTYATSAGYALPQTLPEITLANTGIQPAGTELHAATGPTTAITGRWPYSTGYAVWAGSCADADPAAAPTNGSRAPATVVGPGQTGSVTVELAPVDVSVLDSSGDAVADQAITATKPSGSTAGCDSPDTTLNLGTTNASGELAVSLPDGTWQLTAGTATAQLAVVGNPATVTLGMS